MADVKKGDMVRIDYTGSLVSTGEIFETSDEAVARKAGIFEPTAIYGPKLALFGSGSVMAGLEEAILSSQPGKRENFVVNAEKGFGQRIPGLVRVVPAKDFAKQGFAPAPGMVLTLDGVLARIKSVESGRVVVDFNHPLAGESLLYSLKVLEVISDDKKKIEAILSSLSLPAEVLKKGGNHHVLFGKSAPQEKIEAAKRAISAAVPGTEFKSA
jgi:FKBP-type peptidyl-prolyl cis-trans isomerase 2